jgi:glycosyltransferase involved in cell wall biosynthesis
LEKFSILIFNATHPTTIGGVRRFSEELVMSISSKEPSTYHLFGSKENGLVKGSISLLTEFVRTLRKVDIVHFVVLSPYNIPFLILSKLYRKKVLSSYHGIYTMEVSITKRPHVYILHWLADKLSRVFSDVIISSSAYLTRELKLKKNVVIIRYPSNLKPIDKSAERDRHTRNEILLVTASNFNIQKKSQALHILLEAIEDIVKEYSSVKLLIFGDGEYLTMFKSKYGNRQQVSFMGFRTDFQNFLATSDGYIHMSGLDNQPYSIIDALMHGKIILCNDLEGLVEMLDPNNNYVVPLDSSAVNRALRSLINEILHDRKTLEQKGKRNKLFAVNRYSREVITNEYLKIYNQILRKGRK